MGDHAQKRGDSTHKGGNPTQERGNLARDRGDPIPGMATHPGAGFLSFQAGFPTSQASSPMAEVGLPTAEVGSPTAGEGLRMARGQVLSLEGIPILYKILKRAFNIISKAFKGRFFTICCNNSRSIIMSRISSIKNVIELLLWCCIQDPRSSIVQHLSKDLDLHPSWSFHVRLLIYNKLVKVSLSMFHVVFHVSCPHFIILIIWFNYLKGVWPLRKTPIH